MRRSVMLILPVLMLASSVASADNGDNTQAIADALIKAAAAAGAASAGGPMAMLLAALTVAGGGIFAVLIHQSSKWNMFHAQNSINQAQKPATPPAAPPTVQGPQQ